jgi:hypothetical protein
MLRHHERIAAGAMKQTNGVNQGGLAGAHKDFDSIEDSIQAFSMFYVITATRSGCQICHQH